MNNALLISVDQNEKSGADDRGVIVRDGKLYDVSKSELVAENTNGLPDSDSQYIRERLFLSPRGAWYLVGDGGPDTKYGKKVGNLLVATRNNVRELKRKEAIKFTGEHANTDVIMRYFADSLNEA